MKKCISIHAKAQNGIAENTLIINAVAPLPCFLSIDLKGLVKSNHI